MAARLNSRRGRLGGGGQLHLMRVDAALREGPKGGVDSSPAHDVIQVARRQRRPSTA